MHYEIHPSCFAYSEALFIKPLNLLVIADLQLGREEELRSQGHMVFDKELSSMKRRIGKALKQSGAKRLLINGDLKQEFSRISQQEWSQILDLLDFFREKVEVILVKGNHDNMLFPIAEKRGFVLQDFLLEEGFLFCHGHELPPKETIQEAHTIIIGHEHPAVRFDDGVRSETAKCFLIGPWKKKSLIVLPSFSRMTIGSDILTHDFLGPFLEKKEKCAAFVIVEDAVLRFGTVRDIRATMNK